MSSEKKKRRFAKSQSSLTEPGGGGDDKSSNDELVIDVPSEAASTSSNSKAGAAPTAMVTRSGTPRKATTEKRPPPPSNRKKRRRPRSSSSSSGDTTEELEEDQTTLDETIQRVAVNNNMTQESIKKILKKLVLNEHILATVMLKEEEETRRDKTRRDGTDGDDEDDDEANSLQPKLTRLKAKQLNKQPFPIVPLKTPIADEEVVALIREELHSDEEDEEYKPTEEDEIHSDDDPATTISDIDSQPRTPATPAGASAVEGDHLDHREAVYTRDGLFKVPKPRNDSYCSQQSDWEQENIARRTRSKLCLQTTAIETIESTFVPPDITTDMYDFDCDMDHVWKEFLSEFSKPLANNAEDDDDTDPEYVAADKVPIDREELREVKVSKKELNELVSELLEMSGIIDESMLDESFLNNNTLMPDTANLQTSQGVQNENFLNNSALPDNANAADNVKTEPDIRNSGVNSELNTPKIAEPEAERPPSPVRTVDITVFQPSNISTPSTQPAVSKTAYIRTQPEAVVTNPLPSSVVPQAILSNASIGSDTTIAGGNSQHQVSLIGDFSIQVSTPDESSFYKYYLPSATGTTHPIEARTPVSPSERRYRFEHKLLPVTIIYPEGLTGFTDFQQQLYQQQLRMHVQFAAQNFIQSYAHPKYWSMATTFKKMLVELDEISQTNSAVSILNLKGALDCCLSWEEDLNHPTDENNQMIQYLLEEASKAEEAKKQSKYYQGFFPPKMMEKIITNPAFMYPKLLPYTPFRMDLRSEMRVSRSEERLIAYGLEMFYVIAKEDLNRHKPRKEKFPTLNQVCSYISKYLCTIHTYQQLYTYVVSRRGRGGKMNPIKYYFLHKKVEPFQHVLETSELKEVIPPAAYQRDVLPHLWDKYLYSRERLLKVNSSSADTSIIERHSHPTKVVAPRRNSSSSSNSKNSGQQSSVVPVLTEPNLNITISVVLDDSQQSSTEQLLSTSTTSLQAVAPAVEPVTTQKDQTQVEEEKQQQEEEEEHQPELPVIFDDRTVEVKQESSISINDGSFDGRSLPEDDCLVSGSVPVVPEVATPVRQPPALVKEKEHCCSCRCHTREDRPPDDSNLLLKGQKLLTEYFRPLTKKVVPDRNDRKKELKQKLWEIRCRFRDSCEEKHHPRRGNLRKVYKHFKLIEGFSLFLGELRRMSSNHGSRNHPEDECRNEHSLTNGTCNKLIRLSETEHNDVNYAYNFYEKVEETLLGANQSTMHESFLEILKSYNEADDNISDLYYKIENLFMADHPDLVDMFLTFLLPGQAAEIGKFFEHFILTNANSFLSKLNIFFAKQPSQIKKIYSCLSDLSAERDVSMEQIKTRILPLLKGNPLLVEWFLQLFPPEKPPDGSVADCEIISLKKLPLPDCTDPNEIYEDVPFVEMTPETAPGGESTVCGTKYIQGRIVYGTQPARLSFLAHDCVASASAARKETTPSLNGCVHNTHHPKPSSSAEGGESTDKVEPQDVVPLPQQPEEQLQQEDPVRYKLCDEATLKAHAVRLNPLVHGGKGVSYADVQHLLATDPEAGSESHPLSEEDKPTSPKKHQNIKTIPKKRINSPISKKVSGPAGKCSPTALSVPPKKHPIVIPADSKVISVSKKLKTLIEAFPPVSNQEPSSETPPPPPLPPQSQQQPGPSGVKRKILIPAPQASSSGSTPASVPILSMKKEKQLKKSASDESGGHPEVEQQQEDDVIHQQHDETTNSSTISETNTSISSQSSWTREEDKVILEEIKNGYSVVEGLIQRIASKLEVRDSAEIRLRYDFLMEVLKKFQKGT